MDLASLGFGEVTEYDGIGEFWFDSVENLYAVIDDKEYLAKVAPDERKFTKRDEWKFAIGEVEDKMTREGLLSVAR